MSKKNKNIIEETEIEFNGEKVNLKKLKYKERRRTRNARSSVTTCPNCLSALKLNNLGQWHCTKDRLKLWESEFEKFEKMTKDKKADYITKLSNYGRFLDLYDRWIYSITVGDPSEYDCGYTNNIFPLINVSQTKIPDPIVVKRIEQKLGRKLTEEELANEVELYSYQGRILTAYKKGARLIKIPYIVLPSEETVYV